MILKHAPVSALGRFLPMQCTKTTFDATHNATSEFDPLLPVTQSSYNDDMMLVDDDIGTGTRAKLALDLLSQGRVISYDNISLRVDGDRLAVTIWSTWPPAYYLAHPEAAQDELRVGVQTLQKLQERWPELESLTSDAIPYHELANDYGTGAVRL